MYQAEGDDTVVVFVQVEEEHEHALGDMLGGLSDNRFLFVLLPVDTKLLTKGDIRELLESIL